MSNDDKVDMKETKKLLIFIAIAAPLIAGFYFTWAAFVVNPANIVIKSPTEEQVLALYDYSGDANRVWVDDIEKVFGDNSLIKVTISCRDSEYPAKILEALEYAGIEKDYAIEKR